MSEQSGNGDENVLLDDGFAIVDDINPAEGAAQPNDSNGKPHEDITVEESNSEEVVSDTEVQTDVKMEEVNNDTSISLPEDNENAKEDQISNIDNDGSILDDSSVKLEKTPTENGLETKTPVETAENTPSKSRARKKTADSCFVWVSNITKSIKASTLKKHFSECGKVNTAKVVTNGKVFFGYVEFEDAEFASQCIQKMNNTVLGGRKIVVSATRPDVTKKSASSVKKAVTKSDDEKKVEDDKKVEDGGKKRRTDDKQTTANKKRRISGDSNTVKDVDLRLKLNDSRKRMERLREDFDRSQIEVRNLRRRLTNEQKRIKAEEMRCDKYRSDARNLSDQLKQVRNDYEREIHSLTKKHKMELEKAGYNRESIMKQKESLRRRQEDLDREYKKLDEAKRLLEHRKSTRKSRSLSPPSKRFRERDGMFSARHSPPPPPKLSSKPLLDRPSPYYEEKKSRAVYNRLGGYGDKSYQKEGEVRQRSMYPGDVIENPKSAWSQQPQMESWKKPNNSSTFLKPYMERFGGNNQPTYQAPLTSYYPAGNSNYGKQGHFDNSRKY